MNQNEQEPVFFYEHDFYVFSNFSSFMLEWKGELWMTSEHAYHAEKFPEGEIKEGLRKARSAHDSMKLAYANKDKYPHNWDEIKLDVMKKILHAKVAQHPYVKKKLLDSGDRQLIEDSWRDSYWGWGPNKDGENHLGKLWMEVRDEVRSLETKELTKATSAIETYRKEQKNDKLKVLKDGLTDLQA